MKNKMQDLRDHLFLQLERLNSEDAVPGPEEIARARAISNVAKTLIDSARVEVDFLKIRDSSPRLNGVKSEFLDNGKALPLPALDGHERNP
jgi:hypothetical protein